MLKLITLLVVVVSSNALGQYTLINPEKTKNDVRIGAFIFRPMIDAISDENISYATVLSSNKVASLNLRCSGPYAKIFVYTEDILLSEMPEIGVVVRFDKTPAWNVAAWAPDDDHTGRSAWMPHKFFTAFSRAAYNAKQVTLRAFVGSGDEYRDFVFPIQGYFKAVMRLPCAQAFGFGKAAAPVRSGGTATGPKGASSSDSETVGAGEVSR